MDKNTMQSASNLSNLISIRSHFNNLINGMGDGIPREQVRPVQAKIRQLDKMILEEFLALSLVKEEIPLTTLPAPIASEKKSRVVRRED